VAAGLGAVLVVIVLIIILARSKKASKPTVDSDIGVFDPSDLSLTPGGLGELFAASGRCGELTVR
jgi:hypothetical protein